MSWIEEWVKPGMIALDIGANHGSYTSQLLQAVGPTGRVIAIEPQPTLAPALEAIGATVLRLAAWDYDGAGLLHLGEQSEHASLIEANVLAPTHVALPVRMARLDTLYERGELPAQIDAMKLDTQGAEPAIIRGATRVLREQRPVLFLEIWREGLAQAGSSVEELCEDLSVLGYQPPAAAPDCWTLLREHANREHGHGSIDVLLVPSERRAA